MAMVLELMWNNNIKATLAMKGSLMYGIYEYMQNEYIVSWSHMYKLNIFQPHREIMNRPQM